jgi:hypothetical protein
LFLNITGDNSAYLKFGEGSDNEDYWSWQWVSFEGEVTEGESYYFSWPYESGMNSGHFVVDEIVYNHNNSVENGYIVLTIKINSKLNAYCDIDGQVKQQKTQAWGSCQNNYECESNLCSYGECVDLKGIADQVTGFRGFIVKMLCRLSNPFDDNGYLQCVVDNQ